jgi:hypothetical protein
MIGKAFGDSKLAFHDRPLLRFVDSSAKRFNVSAAKKDPSI